MHTQATKLGAQHSAKCRTRPPRPDRTGLEVGGGGGGSCKSGDTPLFSHTAGWSHLLLWELLGSPAVNRVCVCRTVSSDLIKRLAAGVEQLLALGHPPSAISMFDEAWLLAASLSPLIEELTGNVPLGDWFTFHVHGGAKSQSDLVRNPSSRPRAGWGPHRDRPGGVDQADAQLAPGFREDGSPMYTTVWVALTDATPDNSCLYFLPACNDPGYKKQGDNIEGVFDDLSRWQAISAQPVNAGEQVSWVGPIGSASKNCVSVKGIEEHTSLIGVTFMPSQVDSLYFHIVLCIGDLLPRKSNRPESLFLLRSQILPSRRRFLTRKSIFPSPLCDCELRFR